MLNIVMKKAQNDYFGGSISANASLLQGLRISPSLSTGLNYKQGRVSASLNLDGSLSSIVGNFDTYRTAPSTRLYSASTSSFDYKGRGINIRGGLDYTITPELTVGFTATYAPSRKQTDRTNETRNYTIRPMAATTSSSAYQEPRQRRIMVPTPHSTSTSRRPSPKPQGARSLGMPTT